MAEVSVQKISRSQLEAPFSIALLYGSLAGLANTILYTVVSLISKRNWNFRFQAIEKTLHLQASGILGLILIILLFLVISLLFWLGWRRLILLKKALKWDWVWIILIGFLSWLIFFEIGVNLLAGSLLQKLGVLTTLIGSLIGAAIIFPPIKKKTSL